MLDDFKIKPNRMRARSKAKRLLKECNIISPPVRLSTIVKYLGIFTQKANPSTIDLAKISAFIELEDKILIYNDIDPTVRKRFSVAHEIGHLILQHTIYNDTFNLDTKDIKEIEANMFAAELLIPYDWIKDDLKKWNSTIPRLAQKYWVSQEAMGWRIANSNSLV